MLAVIDVCVCVRGGGVCVCVCVCVSVRVCVFVWFGVCVGGFCISAREEIRVRSPASTLFFRCVGMYVSVAAPHVYTIDVPRVCT